MQRGCMFRAGFSAGEAEELELGFGADDSPATSDLEPDWDGMLTAESAL